MRPTTLAEACRRAQAGEPFDKAVGEFLQSYYLARDIQARVPMLADEPPRFTDPRYDALVGGIAEYLFKRWAPWRPPAWIKSRDRYLAMPWWPVGEGDPALMEYLTFTSPPEFASRNIMTDEAPLRRATQPPVEPLRREHPRLTHDAS